MENQQKNNTAYAKSLGAKIRTIRESMDMTRDQVAAKMDAPCSAAILRQYEDGTRDMDVDVFFSLTKALGVTPNDLAPSQVMENATSGLGDYARLSGSNRFAIDQMIGVFLKQQRSGNAG